MQPQGTRTGSARPSDDAERRRRVRASVSGTGALLLAATGLLAASGTSAPSPGLPGGAATNVLAGGLTDAPDATDVPGQSGVVAPLAPAPPDFARRAAVVADAVRRAGVPTVPAVPVLLSGWALDLGFDTDEQKIAWNARKVDLAPGIQAHTTGTGTMTRTISTTTSGQATRSVGVIGPREALDRALRADSDAPGSCEGVPASCRLVVTRAVRADAPVRTSTGDVRLPVWRLTIDGLSHPVSVVAVVDGALEWHLPGSVQPLPGLPEPAPLVHPADRLIAVSGSTVEVGIGGGACDVDLAAHVLELDDMVVVGGTSQPNGQYTACPSSYVSSTARLQLARPLGSRPVIDVVSGRPRILGVPAY
ncbi:hypothetical protein GCM10009740_04290 [Terrabacter terrae]|uniref:Secreted protein n=1 Tax=Terrabacter terrae TaxID=318434 RepID=A0ABP5F9S7_9MICO